MVRSSQTADADPERIPRRRKGKREKPEERSPVRRSSSFGLHRPRNIFEKEATASPNAPYNHNKRSKDESRDESGFLFQIGLYSAPHRTLISNASPNR